MRNIPKYRIDMEIFRTGKISGICPSCHQKFLLEETIEGIRVIPPHFGPGLIGKLLKHTCSGSGHLPKGKFSL